MEKKEKKDFKRKYMCEKVDTNYEMYEGKGLTGLLNIGNSCYINSICSNVLSHTYELNEFIK